MVVKPIFEFDDAALSALIDWRVIVPSVAAGLGVCAFEWSDWGGSHLAIAPLPTTIVTLLWGTFNLAGSVELLRKRTLAPWVVNLALITQIALCAIHGAAAEASASAAYVLVIIGAMTVARCFRPSHLLYLVYIVSPPLLRMFCHPRIDSSVFVALLFGLAGALTLAFAARIHELQRPMSAALAAGVEWATRMRERPGFELAMLLHDTVSGSLLTIQEQLRRGAIPPATDARLRELLVDLGLRTTRPDCPDIESLHQSLSTLAGSLNVRLALHVDRPDRWQHLPIAMRNDLAIVAREGLVNAVRHATTDEPIEIALQLDDSAAALTVTAGEPKRPIATSTRRGLRNMNLRAATWAGSAVLDITDDRSVLTARMLLDRLPRWSAPSLSIAFCIAFTALIAWWGQSWTAISIGGFLLLCWIAMTASANRVFANTKRAIETARADRIRLEAKEAERTRARLESSRTRVNAALENPAAIDELRSAVDQLADHIAEAIHDLENSESEADVG